MPRQFALFMDVFVMMGTLGAMLRVSLVAAVRIPALRLLNVAMGFGLVANLAVTLWTDPVTQVRPDWTNVPFLIAYAALGCAALHPSAALITQPGAAPRDDLSGARLAFLGIMMALIPLVGGGRVIFGLPTDGLLVALGSAGIIPLVMVRISRLSAQRRRAERALRHAATYDALTGLPNRAASLDRIAAALVEPAERLAVLFGDLDGFKPVNDRLGHGAGDELLRQVADRLRGCLRTEDLVGRFGGDEFVILCPAADVDRLGERIRAMVREPIPVAGEQVKVGISVGVALAQPGSTADDLISRADAAMYAAKQSKAVGALSLAMA
jgi:diguanylate cyclase (GGDEF)-like protein